MSEHIEYSNNKRNWKIVRDLIKGENVLKEYDLSTFQDKVTYGTYNMMNTARALEIAYLPYTSSVLNDENVRRYITYVTRASLFNATVRTKQGLIGMVFSQESTCELPSDLEYLKTNADGSGIGILDQAVEGMGDLLEVARLGLFVDFPTIDGPLTYAQMDELQLRANIIKYDTEQILDWDTTSYGAAEKLTFVKLCETYTERDPDNIFSTHLCVRYRVLMIVDGIYEQHLYNDKGELMDKFIPTDFRGQPFTFIPFFFAGSTDNRPDVDVAPLLELAELNIKHYRNSADYEESTFLVGQPVVGVIGLNQTWIKDNFPNGLTFGSREVIMLPNGSDLKLVQAEPNNMARQGMQDKEAQMVKLGAQLIDNGGSGETATAARIKHSADVSILSVLVKNLSNAYTDAIMAVQLFTGVMSDFEFKINDNFFADSLDSQQLTALVSAWQNQAITDDQLKEQLSELGIK